MTKTQIMKISCNRKHSVKPFLCIRQRSHLDGMIAETFLKWEYVFRWKCQEKSESACWRILRLSTLSMS